MGYIGNAADKPASLTQCQGMSKPAKKKRPADTNTRMHSILQDVIGITNKPIQAPNSAPRKKSR